MEHINPLLMAIFFRGGYAIHGTNMVGRLGRVDSHGCIRLAPTPHSASTPFAPPTARASTRKR